MKTSRFGAFALALAAAGSAWPCSVQHGGSAAAKSTAPQAPKAHAPHWVGPAHSGSWYSPARNGEGFTLQVLDNGSALAVWFTYPPAGSAASQAWIMAQDGVIDGDRIRFETTFTTRGPRFGAQFDPAQLRLIAWGAMEFRFLDCNRGEFRYTGPEGWGSGFHEIVRLTALSELACDGKKRLGETGARSLPGLRQKSGAWFDPRHNGEGWQVEELPDGRAQVYWFTYDEQGEQAWTVGVAPSFGERIDVAQTLRPVGTRFGEAFSSAAVRLTPWGSFSLAFDGCDRARVQYDSTLPAFGAGALSPIRLTRLAGAACVEGNPAVPPQGSWVLGSQQPVPQSETAVATLGGKSCVLGGYDRPRSFQCYDPASDSWSVMPDLPAGRDHAAAVALGDELFVSGGNRADNGAGQDVNGWRFRAAAGAWEPAPQLPDVFASGAALLDRRAYFGHLNGDVTQVDLRTLATRRIHGDGRARDHAQLVAFQGELWFIGGRDTGGVDHGRISIFDPASETWRAGPTLRNSRAGFAAAATATMLFVGGGEKLAVQPWRVLDTVEAIAGGDGQWTIVGRLPVPVHGVSGAIFGDAFYLLGGSGIPGGVGNPGTVQAWRWGPQAAPAR